MNYKFDIPAQTKSIIKVIGVGGGGSKAVKHMHKQGIKDVEFIICNTDKQALESSTVPNKLQIGADLTEGLGAGAKPERGRQAAAERGRQERGKFLYSRLEVIDDDNGFALARLGLLAHAIESAGACLQVRYADDVLEAHP